MDYYEDIKIMFSKNIQRYEINAHDLKLSGKENMKVCTHQFPDFL